MRLSQRTKWRDNRNSIELISKLKLDKFQLKLCVRVRDGIPAYANHEERLKWILEVEDSHNKCVDNEDYVPDASFIARGIRIGPLEFSATTPSRASE